MEFVKELIGQYSYCGIFIALVGGIVGLPIPDELLLIAVGYFSYKGELHLILALLISCLGSTIGISISYYLGKKLGLPFLLTHGSKLFLSPTKIERSQRLFQKYGPFILVVGYFIPGVRHLTGYIAGISNLPFKKFSLYAYSGAIIWVHTFVLAGTYMRWDWQRLSESILAHKLLVGSIIGFLILTFVCSYMAYLSLRRKKLNRQYES
ncbi:DedA family protein [Alkalicoccobacillus murimartini]|uniref:Membrane protein DedA with SNARE-associated domain n=1 Tax=Alkalicoccobacillus murimartini TaxID=171685 RepID=A0ABT9YKZ6_9BACI|nr:DedA family protein [Alkalicoccobacillus murimartini]MDQ0208552.1 membrane protein DedA with SNARE-associated domain [Alkalicoccobacillus murimartini]